MRKNTTRLCIAVSLVLFASVFASCLLPVCGSEILFDYTDDSEVDSALFPLSDCFSETGIFGIEENLYFEEKNFSFAFSVPSLELLKKERQPSGGFTVYAEAYEYVSSSGKTVRWVPDSVKTDGVSVSFTFNGEGYSAALEGQDPTQDAEITYRAEVEFTPDEVNSIALIPYEAGKEAAKLNNEYSAQAEEYNKRSEEYNVLLQNYNSALTKYNAYLEALAEYNAEVKSLDDYFKVLEEYGEVIASYASYASFLEEYKADASEYGSYLADIGISKSKLCVIESVFVKLKKSPTDEKPTFPSVYERVSGNTVTDLLSHKADLIKAGIDERDIKNAGNATEALRKYLDGYSSLGTEREKFDYYKTNYILIKTNFTKLYETLLRFYDSKMIRAELNNRGKTENYESFLGQLSMICLGFENKEASSPTTAVWNPELPSDGSEIPAIGGFVKKNIYSDLTAPVYKAGIISEPPAPVSRPYIPTFEEYVGAVPVPPVLTQAEERLASLAEDGTLVKREVNESVAIILEYKLELDGEEPAIRGDMNSDGKVNTSDAVYLLRHTLYSSRYTILQSGDVNGDTKTDASDAVYLLRHILNPKLYPLY